MEHWLDVPAPAYRPPHAHEADVRLGQSSGRSARRVSVTAWLCPPPPPPSPPSDLFMRALQVNSLQDGKQRQDLNNYRGHESKSSHRAGGKPRAKIRCGPLLPPTNYLCIGYISNTYIICISCSYLRFRKLKGCK